MVSVNLSGNINEFVENARIKSKNQIEHFDKDMEGRNDFVYFSCNPWVSFTGLTHTISLNKNDSVPRISWGKYFIEGIRFYFLFLYKFIILLLMGFILVSI